MMLGPKACASECRVICTCVFGLPLFNQLYATLLLVVYFPA